MDYTSGILLPDCSKLVINWKNDSDVIIFWHDVIVRFFWRGFVFLVMFSYWSKFHVSIITGSGVRQFSFIRDWPEIRKSEIPPSGYCPISGDWVKSGIPNLIRMSLIKCYLMLQNSRVTAFTVSELLRENQYKQGGGGKITPPPPSLPRLSKSVDFYSPEITRKSKIFLWYNFGGNSSQLIGLNSLNIKNKIWSCSLNYYFEVAESC